MCGSAIPTAAAITARSRSPASTGTSSTSSGSSSSPSSICGETPMNHVSHPIEEIDHKAAPPAPAHEGKTHPIGIYLKIWGLLFVLSTMSYLVDYFAIQGTMRWVLIILFKIGRASCRERVCQYV